MSKRSGRQATATRQSPQKQRQQQQRQPQQQQRQPQQQQQKVKSPVQAQTKVLTTDTDVISAEQAKREARLQRQAAARAAAEQRKRAARLRRVGIWSAVAVVVAGLIGWMWWAEESKPGDSVPVMSVRNHLSSASDPHAAYNSDPPTSGPHTEQLPEFKVYTTTVAPEMLVHGLEDGGVVMYYRTGTEQAEIDKLAQIAKVYHDIGGGRSHVILAPHDNLSHPIVLTAWGRIDRLDAFDEARIRRFIDEYVGWDHHEGAEGRRIPEAFRLFWHCRERPRPCRGRGASACRGR